MHLAFGNNDILQKKKMCDREHKLYKAVSRRNKFRVDYSNDIDSSEYLELNRYINSLIEMSKKEVKNHYEQKRLREITKDLWSDYVGNIIRKKHWGESYKKFKREELSQIKLF